MPQTLKVGLFVSLCLAVLGFLIFRVEDWNPLGGESQSLEVVFDSVAGLNDKAPVRVAGVRVGQVDGIGLEGRRARVRLRLEQPVQLTEGTFATLANAGILGDKYVELVPGPSSAPALPAGTLLEGETPVSFDEALERFDSLGQSLQELSGDVSSRGDLGSSIRRLLDNLEATSADIRSLVAANRGQVDSTVANFERFSGTLADQLPELADQMSRMLDVVEAVIAENRGDLDQSLGNVRELTDNLKVSVDNLNDISGQIRSGEGTLGKLVYDDSAHDGLVSTLSKVEEGVGSLSETLDRVTKLELELGLEAAYFTDLPDDDDSGGAAFQLQLQNHPNRFYRLGIADYPPGRLRTETRTLITTLPDGRVETTTIEERREDDGDFGINAQLGYRWGDFDLRAGLIESNAGVGVDYHALGRRLIVSLEAYDFSREDDLEPHLRLTGRWHLNPNVYLLGGYDDFLTDDTDSILFGAGIRWRDDDLKYLLGSVPLSF
ncbi:MAG: MlaD family protein [Acidobacteriota bacterium]